MVFEKIGETHFVQGMMKEFQDVEIHIPEEENEKKEGKEEKEEKEEK